MKYKVEDTAIDRYTHYLLIKKHFLPISERNLTHVGQHVFIVYITRAVQFSSRRLFCFTSLELTAPVCQKHREIMIFWFVSRKMFVS